MRQFVSVAKILLWLVSFGVIASADEVCWYAQICYRIRGLGHFCQALCIPAEFRLYHPFRGWHLVVTRAGESLLCLARYYPFWASTEFATIHVRALYFAAWAKLVYKLTAQINRH